MTGGIRVSRRSDGAARITQGRSFILLNRDELAELIKDLSEISRDGSPRADAVSRIGELH